MHLTAHARARRLQTDKQFAVSSWCWQFCVFIEINKYLIQFNGQLHTPPIWHSAPSCLWCRTYVPPDNRNSWYTQCNYGHFTNSLATPPFAHTHSDSIRQRVIYILCAKNLQQLFTFWTIFMSEIAFGIGVCTKCLILDVTSAELPTDLLWCEQVRARSRPSMSTERLVHLGKIVYLNTRRNDINFMCARRCFFRVHK